MFDPLLSGRVTMFAVDIPEQWPWSAVELLFGRQLVDDMRQDTADRARWADDGGPA